MDNPPRPEEGYANAGRNVPATETSSLTTDNDDFNATIQRVDKDLIYHMSKESNGNAPMSTSEGTAHSNQEFPATCSRYQNTSSSINSQGSFDINAETRSHPAPYNKAMVSTVPTLNWNRSVSNNRMTTGIHPDHKRTRSVIRGENGKALSTDSEQKGMHYSKPLETNTTCQASSDRSLLAGIDHKIKNSKQAVSNNPQNAMLRKRSCSLGQNFASNTNIADKSRSNASSDVLDSIPLKMERIRSTDSVVAVPGPSGFHRNACSTNISGDTFQPCLQAKMLSIKHNLQKAMCNVCRSDIVKHAYKDGNKMRYSCCICSDFTSEKGDLQKHSDSHLPKKSCNVCQKEHTEGNSHNGDHTCSACEETFHCKTQLDEHILTMDDSHITYFDEHCWACSMSLNDHLNKNNGEEVYACCICPFEYKDRLDFRKHLIIHRPKIFCPICKEEYQREQKDLHGSEFTCGFCKETFRCKTTLEDHIKDLENHFDVHCMVCDKIIEDDHKIKTSKTYFNCCECCASFRHKFELQNHLYSHLDLNLFKCDTCGERLQQPNALKYHSWSCPAVPYKCKSCKAKFPRKDFLDLHCSVKHKMV